MHRAKTFMHNLGEDILKGMEKVEKNITPAQLTMLASMAEDYNELCEFIEKHGKHKMGMDEKVGVMENPDMHNPHKSYFGG